MTPLRRRALVPGLLLPPLCGCGTYPTQTVLTLEGSAQLNPNSENQPSPTVVRIYGLKSLDTFKAATFFQLYDADKATLGADMLSRREVIVEPGKTLALDGTEEAGTEFVGVVAAFRQLDGTSWRASLKINPEEKNRLIVTLQTTAVTIRPKPSRFLWIF